MHIYVKIDVTIDEHPKLLEVGPLAAWAYISSITYCGRNLTDGFIPEQKGAQLAASEATSDRLLEAGLWERTEGGYRVHDYLEHQTSKADILQLREDRKAAGALGGKASHRAKDKHLLKQNSSKTPAEVEVELTEELSTRTKTTTTALPPRSAAAFATLAAVEKPGYGEVKFTPARFAALAAQHPHLDLLTEAEKLRDWETYGAGERQQTRDGITRLRNWLSRATDGGQARTGTYALMPLAET